MLDSWRIGFPKIGGRQTEMATVASLVRFFHGGLLFLVGFSSSTILSFGSLESCFLVQPELVVVLLLQGFGALIKGD